MPPRSKKITSKLVAKKKTIRHSPPTLQPQQVPEEEEEEEQKVSADLNEMADSSNGKLEGAENVQPEDVGDSKPVVESVRDIAIDDCSKPAKETRDDADDSSSSSSSSSDEEAEGARVANDSGEVEETEEVVVSVVETVESVYNHLDPSSVGVETKVEEEKVAASLDETGESWPAITEEVSKQIEEKTLSYVEESNGVALVETKVEEVEEEKVAVSLDATGESWPAITKEVSKQIEEKTLSYVEESNGVALVETKVEEVEEEKVAVSLDESETGESWPAITEEVSKQIEEKTLSYVEESNGVALVETDLVSEEVEESCAPVITDVVSKGTEEAEVPCSDEKEAVPAAVADIVSKGIEETKLPVSEEQTGESSGTAYKEEVPAVESADAGQDHGKAEIPESTGNPSIVSVAGRPLQPTSWKSCCGLFEILHRRSDR